MYNLICRQNDLYLTSITINIQKISTGTYTVTPTKGF